MKVLFKDGELAWTCNDDAARRDRYGPALASIIRRRLGEISAVTHLAELRQLPAARLRPGPKNDGHLLISLGATADLLVRPRDDPSPLRPDGQLDEYAVRAIIITAITLTS
ncbi:hypothetical protein ABZW18_32790 [Streptomyces sp. NPDC004647]|uniref:hypothetical protein n=1 Tax=Streptomyces sp. NPDC004647 TaxID=3154671 RepID=UPI0033BC80E4